MCGIALTLESEERCYEMLQRMEHRGLPGTAKVVKSGPFYIGHNRLPIIDLSVLQNQPMESDDIVLAFNGEIYNHIELNPYYNSDTEFLCDAISRARTSYKIAQLFEKVDGMYAIAYHRKEEKFLTIITDFLNKKQLYYDEDRQEVASEIKALNTDSMLLDKHYQAEVVMNGYCRTNRTPFLNIKLLQPNCIYHFYGNMMKTERRGLVDMDPIDHKDLPNYLSEAVTNRLFSSDVPVGFLLSGGLDSSLISAIASHNISYPLRTFSIENGETEYSDLMASELRSNHTKLSTKLACTEVVLYHNETPVDLGSVVPQYILCRAIKAADMRVCITGDGADELFGGYTRMSRYIHPVMDTQYNDVFRELPFYHCPRLDKMSMAHTVELRSPFLAKSVIRAALSIPYADRIEKRYLKNIAKGLIPDEIIDRPKVPLRSAAMLENKENFKVNRLREYYSYIEEKGGLYR